MIRAFSIDSSARAGRHVLVLHGELDLLSAPELAETFTRLCSQGVRELLLDLRDLQFIDSSGLRALLLGAKFCTERGCAFALGEALPPEVTTALSVAGLRESFDYAPLEETPARATGARR